MSRDPDNGYGRRLLLGAGAGLIGWGMMPTEAAEPRPTAATPAGVPDDAVMVTLLGTGSPDLRMDRFGMSTLVQAGGLNLVFDAGRGCALRLNQVGLALGKVDAVFITHFHSDHLNGLPDLWMTGYLPASFGRRAQPLQVYGPKGVDRIAGTMRSTFGDDVRIRIADEHRPEASTEIVTHEFSSDGVMYEHGGVVVTAFAVDHGPLIKPAYGYRIDYKGRSVLLSGDTRFDENLIAHGAGVELMVHEVAVAPGPMLGLPWVQAILDHHTTPEQAGIVFSRTKPKLAVFSHIVEIADGDHPRPGSEGIERRTRTNWDGNLAVGADLDRLVLTANGVSMLSFDQIQGRYPG